MNYAKTITLLCALLAIGTTPARAVIVDHNAFVFRSEMQTGPPESTKAWERQDVPVYSFAPPVRGAILNPASNQELAGLLSLAATVSRARLDDVRLADLQNGIWDLEWQKILITINHNFNDLVFNLKTSMIPEPGVLILVGLGLTGLIGLARRKVTDAAAHH